MRAGGFGFFTNKLSQEVRMLRTAFARSAALRVPHVQGVANAVRHSSHAAAETYDQFNSRYASFFASAQDLFELQRGLNNCFAYDLVPSVQGL